jgi:hypothetical protein
LSIEDKKDWLLSISLNHKSSIMGEAHELTSIFIATRRTAQRKNV